MNFTKGVIYRPQLRDKPYNKSGIISIPTQFGNVLVLSGSQDSSVTPIPPNEIPGLTSWFDAKSSNIIEDTGRVVDVQDVEYSTRPIKLTQSDSAKRGVFDGVDTIDFEDAEFLSFPTTVDIKTAVFAFDNPSVVSLIGVEFGKSARLQADGTRLIQMDDNFAKTSISGTTLKDRNVDDATAMDADFTYEIKTVGTTDFTLVGAPDNNVGTIFQATGAGTGDGTVYTQTTTAEGNTNGDTFILIEFYNNETNFDQVLAKAFGSTFSVGFKRVMTFDGELTEDEKQGLYEWLAREQGYQREDRWLVFGSSLTEGANATSSEGWAYQTFIDHYLYGNIAVGGTNTQYWIDNIADVNDIKLYDNLVLGLELSNEGENVASFKAGIPQILNLLDSDKVVLMAPTAKVLVGGSANRYDVSMWEETDLDNIVFGAMGSCDDLNDGIISACNADDLHYTNLGHTITASAVSRDVLSGYASGTFIWNDVPNSITNTTKWLYKPDANTQNPAVIETPATDRNLVWNLRFEFKADDTTQSKNFLSINQGSVSFRMYLDTDNVVKITGTGGTISTGITNLTMGTAHTIELRYNNLLSLRCYVDGVYAGRVIYNSWAPTALTSNTKVVLGGLYNDSSNDAIETYFRNVVLHRQANNPTTYTDSADGSYIVKASQEFYNQLDDLSDLTNKSQTTTDLTINDSNMVVVTD